MFSSSQTPFISSVLAKVNDPQESKAFIAAKQNALTEPHLRARIFDDLSCLITDTQLKELTIHLKQIILVCNPKQNQDGKWEFTSLEERKRITELQECIAKIAISNLLNDKGHIQQQITILMKWDKLTQEQVYGVMVAFVGKVNQELSMTAADLMKDYNNSAAAFFGFVNENYGKITLNVMREQKLIFDAKSFVGLNTTSSQPLFGITDHKSALGFGLALLGVSGALAASFLFFNKNTSGSTVKNGLNSLPPGQLPSFKR